MKLARFKRGEFNGFDLIKRVLMFLLQHTIFDTNSCRPSFSTRVAIELNKKREIKVHKLCLRFNIIVYLTTIDKLYVLFE